MFTSKKAEIINKHNFVKSTLDKNFKTFIIYMAVLKIETLIYLLQKT